VANPAHENEPAVAHRLGRVTVIEGLRWTVLFGAYGEAEALAVLDAALDRVLGARRNSRSRSSNGPL